MRKTLLAVAVLALLLTATVVTPAPAFAQIYSDSAKAGPPPVLQIFREQVKPGKGPAHEKVEASWAAAYKKADLKYYYLGTTTMTGPIEAWFLEAFASMEDVEKANQALAANKAAQAEIDRIGATDGDLLTGARSSFAFYSPELSYRPDFNIGDYKYLMVDTTRLKLGHYEKFAELRKAINAAHEKADLDEHMLVYNVGLGAPGGTVIVIEPLKSLKEWDEAGKTHGKGSAYYEAVGDAGRKVLTEFVQNDLQSFQRDFLAISPGMSVVSDKVIAANPSFWKPKMAKMPAKAMTPATKMEPMKSEKK